MKWSEQAWKTIQPVYDKIIELPFITGLINGRLSEEKFIFYIRQDALYLAEYGKILAGIASRLQCPEHVESFLYFAGDTMQVEKALHESFFKTQDGSGSAKPSPTCLLYTSYLHGQLVSASVEVAVAAVLPCFWIYREVGNYILAHQIKENNPYQQWIDTYGGDEFSIAVDKAIFICDELAGKCTEEQRRMMTDAFIKCTQMEWMFWDSAWRLEQWPI